MINTLSDNLIIKNPSATYYFEYKGHNIFNIKYNDTLVVDKNIAPTNKDIVVATKNPIFEHMNHETIFHVIKFKNIKDFDLWGTIINVIKK